MRNSIDDYAETPSIVRRMLTAVSGPGGLAVGVYSAVYGLVLVELDTSRELFWAISLGAGGAFVFVDAIEALYDKIFHGQSITDRVKETALPIVANSALAYGVATATYEAATFLMD